MRRWESEGGGMRIKGGRNARKGLLAVAGVRRSHDLAGMTQFRRRPVAVHPFSSTFTTTKPNPPFQRHLFHTDTE